MAMRIPPLAFRFLSFYLLVLAFVTPNGYAISPQLICHPSNLRFGEVAVGQRETMSATIFNSGPTSLTLSEMQLIGAGFSVSQPVLPFNLAPGQKTNLTVIFEPAFSGRAAGSIAFNDNAPFLYLHGWGLHRHSLEANPASLKFGNVQIGTRAKVQVILSNSGTLPVAISQDSVTGAGFSAEGLTLPFTLIPGQSQTLTITFAPQSAGTAAGAIRFSSATWTLLTIPLGGAGVGAAAPQLTIAPATANFGNVPIGSNTTQIGVLSAPGPDVTVSSASSTNSEFSLSGLSLPVTVPSGKSVSFTITFAPRTAGAASASVSFASNAGSGSKTIVLSGSGNSLHGSTARGLFMLNPPVDDKRCSAQGPPSCYSAHLVPTFICMGKNVPAGYNCLGAGAGAAYIKGAVFQVPWVMINPGNGTYNFSGLDGWMQPWIDSGKLTSFIFQPTSFGYHNGFTPAWYLAQAPISSVAQTGGIISLKTSADMGFFPGGSDGATGLEIQIVGTGTTLDGNGTSANPGLWKVCDHTTAGCQDPTARTISAIGSGSDIAEVSKGKVGNPVYGSSDGSTCPSGIIPIQWRPNFMKAWQEFMKQVVQRYGTDSHVGYMRFGMGVGGQSNPTAGTNLPACQAQMAKFGFTKATPPWPAPDSAQWSEVSAVWIAYMNAMSQYMHSLNSAKPVMLTLSPIRYDPIDLTTPDAEAANAAAAGVGFGNQGLNRVDPLNAAAGRPCPGGDWCANFQRFRDRVPLELQTVLYSDPTDASTTGSLVNLLPFAITGGADIIELYPDDWLCTFDSAWRGVNTYPACTSAGYHAVFLDAADRIN
jgi:hypothetical protein